VRGSNLHTAATLPTPKSAFLNGRHDAGGPDTLTLHHMDTGNSRHSGGGSVKAEGAEFYGQLNDNSHHTAPIPPFPGRIGVAASAPAGHDVPGGVAGQDEGVAEDGEASGGRREAPRLGPGGSKTTGVRGGGNWSIPSAAKMGPGSARSVHFPIIHILASVILLPRSLGRPREVKRGKTSQCSFVIIPKRILAGPSQAFPSCSDLPRPHPLGPKKNDPQAPGPTACGGYPTGRG